MNTKKLILITVMIASLVLVMSQFSTALSIGYASQAYTYNRPSYNNQYNYRYNSFGNNFIMPNAYRTSGAANYVGGYGNYGLSPFLFGTPSKCGITKCKTVSYTSHMYVGNKLDYQYYTHPELFQPRRMSNHQRWVSGVSW